MNLNVTDNIDVIDVTDMYKREEKFFYIMYISLKIENVKNNTTL